MATVQLGPNTASTNGELPAVGTQAPEFKLIANDMSEVKLSDFKGKTVILNIFPSVDTGVCSASVREFNKRAAGLKDTVVLCVSKDLPFANKRFCGAEGIQNVQTLSDYRNAGFSKSYGIEMTSGGFAGLFARAVVVIDGQGKVKYTQLVPQVGQEPNYDQAISAL